MEQFQEKVNELFAKHETLLSRKKYPFRRRKRNLHPLSTPCTDSRTYPDLLEI